MPLEVVGEAFGHEVRLAVNLHVGTQRILKDILHDWDDARAVQILRNCRAAMEENARLLIVERIVNMDAGTLMLDITMLVMTGGKERTEAEYAALLESAGFALHQVVPIAAGHMLEAHIT